MVMKHTEDEGDLSLFASGDQILIACSKGYFWVLDASQQLLSKSPRHVDAADSPTLASLHDRFGKNSVMFLRSDRRGGTT
ncbi:hypothetical protein ACQPW1_18600 [Nocardia sp. CA-128927]|uniref:hypothetical protein n=1 Tax=Nocardia sp. CA-128927 TaxID=3239975 RepID=UPI003D99D86F